MDFQGMIVLLLLQILVPLNQPIQIRVMLFEYRQVLMKCGKILTRQMLVFILVQMDIQGITVLLHHEIRDHFELIVRQF
jgi:hypothetical protein